MIVNDPYLRFQQNEFKKTVLHVSINRNARAMAILLIQLGCDVNAEDMRKSSPLLYAVKLNLVDMAILLIANGANCFYLDENSKNLFYSTDNPFMKTVLGRGRVYQTVNTLKLRLKEDK
jgi:ankyrin repeat protein